MARTTSAKVPSELMVPRKSATPLLELGGTSPNPTMWAEMIASSSVFAVVEKLPNTRTAMAASAALMHSFFIFLLLSRHQEHAGLGERGVLPSRRLKD